MYNMLGFVTDYVPQPWTESDVNYYKQYGSQRDNIIYNSKINARFKLESESRTGVNMYSCAIKLSNGKYQNLTIAPITFNRFFIVIYIPELAALHKLKRNAIIDKILPKFSLLEMSVKSATEDDGIEFTKYCRFMGDCIWFEVHAPINQLLFPRNENILNEEILDSYKKICHIYNKIQQQVQLFIENCNKAYDLIRNKHQSYLNEQKRLANEKIKNFLVRKGTRIAISAAIALATGGVIVDIGGVCDMFADIDDILDFANVSDMFCNVDLDSFDLTDVCIPDYDMSDLEDIGYYDYQINEYEYLENSHNISFGAQNETLTSRGGGQHIDVTIKKEPGTSNTFTITSNKGTVCHVSGCDNWIKINGIDYKLPKLKG